MKFNSRQKKQFKLFQFQVQYQFTAETAKVQGHTFGMKNDTGDLILINHLDREKVI